MKKTIRFIIWLAITVGLILIAKQTSAQYEFTGGEGYTVHWVRASGGARYDDDVYFNVYSQSTSIGTIKQTPRWPSNRIL